MFVRGETLELSTARPKVRFLRKSRPRNAEEIIGDPATIFSSTWNQLHAFFLIAQRNCAWPLCKADTHNSKK